MPIKEIVEPEVSPSIPSGLRDRDHEAFAARLSGDSVLVCSGELDPATTPALRRALRRVLRLVPDRVVVDFSRVSFFDAGAIGELVQARTTSRAAGGDLVVRDPSPFGRRVLKKVGLANLIAKDPARDGAPRFGPAAAGAPGAEVLAAWTAACRTSRYGATPLGFDASAMVDALIT